MTYEKPELKLEKYTFEPVMADVTSSIDPTEEPTTEGPIIEENNPFIETKSAFGSVLNIK